MEAQLFEAACSGNLQALSDIVRQSGVAVLLRLHLSGSIETPLHLASMFRQTEFVREYMMLSSISAYQLFQTQFRMVVSQVYLASATCAILRYGKTDQHTVAQPYFRLREIWALPRCPSIRQPLLSVPSLDYSALIRHVTSPLA
ncbi:UNVERIFIED_CONTAM: hypothetical protein Sradi_4954500 [Sesamum radiatum]|uniref:Uncharacterized protein n=1 Tax=Sesamum radiatum TaxID=300843 RepID=A0AAW2MGZ3_SESRA